MNRGYSLLGCCPFVVVFVVVLICFSYLLFVCG